MPDTSRVQKTPTGDGGRQRHGTEQSLEAPAPGEHYDVIIIGGGPAGLSAAIYCARFRLRTLVIDKGRGRTFWANKIHNYFGFPEGVKGRELLDQGRDQAERFGAEFLDGFVEHVSQPDDDKPLQVTTKIGRKDSRWRRDTCQYLVIASGIMDLHPDIKNKFVYAGISVHYCMVCDGFEMIDKKVAVFADCAHAVGVAETLRWFTEDLVVLTNGKQCGVTDKIRKRLSAQGIDLIEKPIDKILGKKRHIEGVAFTDGSTIDVDAGYVSMGSTYYNQAARDLSLELIDETRIVVDEVNRTSNPRVYAIGDLRPGGNQVAIAVGAGAVAGTDIWRQTRRHEQTRP